MAVNLYYSIAIIGRKSPPLIYIFHEPLERGECVYVPLKTHVTQAVVLNEVNQPSFECKNIISRMYCSFTPLQIKMAYFISSYYICTLGESFQLFTPAHLLPHIFQNHINANLKTLSLEQEEVFQSLLTQKTSLIFGDTGSGKTEIYFHLIDNIIKKDKQALFLMPEISLTPQIEQRLKNVFGKNTFGIWHSKISKKKKKDLIDNIQQGNIQIIAGARSALFLPLHQLGLIIVDEEHDDAYKAQGTPCYNARDLAIWLSAQEGISTILGSATPSASTYHKLQKSTFRLKGGYFKESGKNIHFILGSDEPTEQAIHFIDKTLQQKQQAIVFLPTRANYKYIICPSCAKYLECQNCSIALSYHEKEQKITCHHCGYSTISPKKCPYCANNLIFKRIGTIEVVKKLELYFPKKTIQRLDRDSVTSLKKLHDILQDFNDGDIDILVGTQMVSKGHDYHNVGLVVVLGIDYLLRGIDYRSTEYALSLIVQLCGRSGRKNKGEVIIQTGASKFLNQCLQNYENFLKNELYLRGNDYPPFARLAMIYIKHKHQRTAFMSFEYISLFMQQQKRDFKIIAQGACITERLAGKWRFFILITSPSTKVIHSIIFDLLKYLNSTQGSMLDMLHIDIDPFSFT